RPRPCRARRWFGGRSRISWRRWCWAFAIFGSGRFDGVRSAGCRRQGQAMQRHEPIDIEPRPDVSPGKHEGDGKTATAAPLEDGALALGENFLRDPRQTSRRAVLERIHARVVQTEIEAFLALVRIGEDLANRG